MILRIKTPNGIVGSVYYAYPSTILADLEQCISQITKYKHGEQTVFFHGHKLELSMSMEQLGLHDGDEVLVYPQNPIDTRSTTMIPSHSIGLYEGMYLRHDRTNETNVNTSIHTTTESSIDDNPLHSSHVFKNMAQLYYVQLLLNGEKSKFLINSGSTFSFVSKLCAERCGLIDISKSEPQNDDTNAMSSSVKVMAGIMTIGKLDFPIKLFMKDELEFADVDVGLGYLLLKALEARIDFKRNILDVCDQHVPLLSISVDSIFPESPRIDSTKSVDGNTKTTLDTVINDEASSSCENETMSESNLNHTNVIENRHNEEENASTLVNNDNHINSGIFVRIP